MDGQQEIVQSGDFSELSISQAEVLPDLTTATFVSRCRKRGRPRGACTTAIGLPKAKKQRMGKKTPFHMLDVRSKQHMLLSWITDEQTIYNVVHKRCQLSEAQVPNASEMPSQWKDQQVDINVLRRFFDGDGWAAIEKVYQESLVEPWKCSKCVELLSDRESIGCDACLEWNHLDCVTLKKVPRSKYWFCPKCK